MDKWMELLTGKHRVILAEKLEIAIAHGLGDSLWEQAKYLAEAIAINDRIDQSKYEGDWKDLNIAIKRIFGAFEPSQIEIEMGCQISGW